MCMYTHIVTYIHRLSRAFLGISSVSSVPGEITQLCKIPTMCWTEGDEIIELAIKSHNPKEKPGDQIVDWNHQYICD